MAERNADDADPACRYPAALLLCSDFVLGTVAMTVADVVEQTLAPLDLRLRHYRLLRLLLFEGTLLQSAIGAAIGVDRTTVVALVDYLEKRKLARRVRSPEDRRAYCIELTAKGRQAALKASELVAHAEERMFSPLGQREREQFRYLATRLLSEPGAISEAHVRAQRGGL